MRIALQQPYVQAYREHALEADGDARPAVAQPRGDALPQAAVGTERLHVRAHDFVKVRARNLLFALDDPAQRQRQLTLCLAKRADDSEPHRELAFVVRRAAGKKLPVAQRRFERRRLPQLQRADRLNVVVVVQKQRVIAAPTQLAINGRRPTADAQLARLESCTAQQLFGQLRGLVELTRFGGYAPLTTEQLQNTKRGLLDPLLVQGHDFDPTLLLAFPNTPTSASHPWLGKDVATRRTAGRQDAPDGPLRSRPARGGPVARPRRQSRATAGA